MGDQHLKDIHKEIEISDNYEILTNAVKVHTKDTDLNEDTTLANLDVSFSKFAQWIAENIHTLGILKSYMKYDYNFIKRSNVISTWGEKEEFETPTNKSYGRVKKLLMNHVQARLILSRSNKGRPLKAFLEYGQERIENNDSENKPSIKNRLMGQKQTENTL
jgi:hypothetical protein